MSYELLLGCCSNLRRGEWCLENIKRWIFFLSFYKIGKGRMKK